MSQPPSPEWVHDVLNTRLCALLNIRLPIIQAGMGYLARQELAAAVSEAGGLGVVGAASNITPEELATEIEGVKSRTDRPFGVNLLFPRWDDSEFGRRAAQDLNDKVDIILSAKVSVLSAGLGVPPSDAISRCKAAGVKVMCTIGTVRHAEKAQALGVDVLVAQGWEAGGHNGPVASMALLPQVKRVARVPFAAAGGIASGSGLVAALALGASAAYMGTAFATCHEADAHERYKQAIVDASATSTVVTRAHSGKPCRVLENDFTRYFDAHPEEIRDFPEQRAIVAPLAAAVRVHGDVQAGGAPAGQISGYLERTKSAKDVVLEIIAEARAVLSTELASR